MPECGLCDSLGNILIYESKRELEMAEKLDDAVAKAKHQERLKRLRDLHLRRVAAPNNLNLTQHRCSPGGVRGGLPSPQNRPTRNRFWRSEERRVGEEWRSRGAPYH